MSHRQLDAHQYRQRVVQQVRLLEPVEMAKAMDLLPDIDKYYAEISRRYSYLCSENVKAWLKDHHCAFMPDTVECQTCQNNWFGMPVATHKTEDCGVPKQHTFRFLTANTQSYCVECGSTSDEHTECPRTTPICIECRQDGLGERRHRPESGFCQVAPGWEAAQVNATRAQQYYKTAKVSLDNPFHIVMYNDVKLERPIPLNQQLLGCPAYQGNGTRVQYARDAKRFAGLIPAHRKEERARIDQLIRTAAVERIGRYALPDDRQSDDGWGPQQQDPGQAIPKEVAVPAIVAPTPAAVAPAQAIVAPRPEAVAPIPVIDDQAPAAMAPVQPDVVPIPVLQVPAPEVVRPGRPAEFPGSPEPQPIDIQLLDFINGWKIGKIGRQAPSVASDNSVEIPNEVEIHDRFINTASDKIHGMLEINDELRARLEQTARKTDKLTDTKPEPDADVDYHTRHNLLQQRIRQLALSEENDLLQEIISLQQALTGRNEGETTFQNNFLMAAMAEVIEDYHELLTKLAMVFLLHDRSVVTRLQHEGALSIGAETSTTTIPSLQLFARCPPAKRTIVYALFRTKHKKELRENRRRVTTQLRDSREWHAIILVERKDRDLEHAQLPLIGCRHEASGGAPLKRTSSSYADPE
ncbi:unnamed protein product [Caenorhabditis brenneri]